MRHRKEIKRRAGWELTLLSRQSLLGARTLEGLNLNVDSARKKRVAAGPLPAAICVATDA